MGYIEDLRKIIGPRPLNLAGVFSGKEFFVKLPNGDEFYPITIAYMCKEIKGGTLQADGTESLEVKFFNLNQLPESISPFIKKLIQQ
ncbi:hypothetical protein IIW_01263 [Bacillus cereus VD136]|nr:hypothetical protein IIW_01263 [Bacillus cereus VD136]EOP73215.1 hypothetical protein KOW_00625 [Bacillus cereus VDM006]